MGCKREVFKRNQSHSISLSCKGGFGHRDVKSNKHAQRPIFRTSIGDSRPCVGANRKPPLVAEDRSDSLVSYNQVGFGSPVTVGLIPRQGHARLELRLPVWSKTRILHRKTRAPHLKSASLRCAAASLRVNCRWFLPQRQRPSCNCQYWNSAILRRIPILQAATGASFFFLFSHTYANI